MCDFELDAIIESLVNPGIEFCLSIFLLLSVAKYSLLYSVTTKALGPPSVDLAE